jgi:hypothetical protein
MDGPVAHQLLSKQVNLVVRRRRKHLCAKLTLVITILGADLPASDLYQSTPLFGYIEPLLT